MKPTSSGYADVNGIKLYHEIYGVGEPLVLIHGGLDDDRRDAGMGGTAGEDAAGDRGGDAGARPYRRHGPADALPDVGRRRRGAAWTTHIPKADLVGHSFGAASAIRTAIQHPGKVRRLVVISSAYAKSGWYPEAQRGMRQVGASMAEKMMHTPTGRFSRQWPEPQRFPQFLDKMGKLISDDYDWSADIARLPMPVLLVFADNDSISQKHVAEFFALLGGGVTEPGWVNTQMSKSRLAVVPGYSHYNLLSSPEVPQLVGKFLADPLTNPPTGATPASQATRT